MTQRSELACIHHSWSCFSSLCSVSLLFFAPQSTPTPSIYVRNQFSSIQYCLFLSLTDSTLVLPEPNAQTLFIRRFHSLITNLFCFVFRSYFIFSTCLLTASVSVMCNCEIFFSFSGQNFGRHFSFADNFIDLQLDLLYFYMLKTQTR